ncbi:hypothetical protein [Methylorubrum thiocyanatum]|uniref:hypothetical protein n=1 Tax=Methylorubrum thiocyanatum TaxID=47958 RepID=UPI0035C797A7
MSANPEAFDRLRLSAYRWVAKHGRDQAALRAALANEMTVFRNEPGDHLTDAEATAMIDAIASWTIANFTPGRRTSKTPRRTRIDRAVEAGLIVMLADGSSGSTKRRRDSSVRALAQRTGVSKSRVGRVLAAERKRRIVEATRSSLTPRSKAILELLEAALPLNGVGFIRVADLSSAIWGDCPVSRTTPLMRDRRVSEALREIDAADLGYQIVYDNDLPGVVAVSRGRRWDRFSDLHADVEAFKANRRFLTVSGVVIRSRLGPVWGSREGREVIAAYRIAMGIMQWQDLQVLLEACDWTVDPIPVLHIIDFLFHVRSSEVEQLTHEMIAAADWIHVSTESARVLTLFSRVLKDLSAIGRDDRAALVVERVLEVSNWGDRYLPGGNPDAAARFAQLRTLAAGFRSFDDFVVEMQRTVAQHQRGRRIREATGIAAG